MPTVRKKAGHNAEHNINGHWGRLPQEVSHKRLYKTEELKTLKEQTHLRSSKASQSPLGLQTSKSIIATRHLPLWVL